jgi:hypothetical protein
MTETQKKIHAYEYGRRRKHFINKLKDDRGGVVEGNCLKQFIANQYQQLFFIPSE